ncbi:hypothetical protein [Amycolatopsis sp. NPDC004079]|uniref:hypothetical protein n=1 Tax=Amycolatopsis sp. NPDC004079 TaxID=3154549 RepID=UPI0033A9BC8F
MRVFREIEGRAAKPTPAAIRSFIAPRPYDRRMFSLNSRGYEQVCSHCNGPAIAMLPTSRTSTLRKRRWNALCQLHDHRRRWLCDRADQTWWYLPPPLANDARFWWYLERGSAFNYFLRPVDDAQLMDTGEVVLYRARVVVERYFANRYRRAADSD